jgi:hypothetical protein
MRFSRKLSARIPLDKQAIPVSLTSVDPFSSVDGQPRSPRFLTAECCSSLNLSALILFSMVLIWVLLFYSEFAGKSPDAVLTRTVDHMYRHVVTLFVDSNTGILVLIQSFIWFYAIFYICLASAKRSESHRPGSQTRSSFASSQMDNPVIRDISWAKREESAWQGENIVVKVLYARIQNITRIHWS